jgi:tetratricopeptide (TPR) repeat protein
MTAFMVAACRSVNIDAKFAEALNTNHWRKVGGIVRFERHVVATIPIPPREDLVADFLPRVRSRIGTYFISIIPEVRMGSMFYSNRAVELLDSNQPDEALVCAEKAINVDPTFASAWNIQGVVLAALGRTADAESAYRKALSVDPRDLGAVGNMEKLMRNLGQEKEAAKYRQLGEDIRKRDPYFHAFIADEAYQEGNLDEAERRIDIAIKLLAYEPEFYLTQTRIHLARGQVKKAIDSLEKAKRWAQPGERERYDTKLEILKRQNP